MPKVKARVLLQKVVDGHTFPLSPFLKEKHKQFPTKVLMASYHTFRQRIDLLLAHLQQLRPEALVVARVHSTVVREVLVHEVGEARLAAGHEAAVQWRTGLLAVRPQSFARWRN